MAVGFSAYLVGVSSSWEIEERSNNVVFGEYLEAKEEKAKKEIKVTSQKLLFSS